MSISQRVSIAWAPAFETHEPTNTLVLTGNTYFVDQRILKSPTSPNKVDWAFAGTRSSSQTPSGKLCRWNHWIDSRSLEPATDEGYMYHPHPDHPDDNSLSLEKGKMAHPETGVVTEYEEVWRDLDAQSGSRVTIWERKEKESEAGMGAMVAVIGTEALAVGRESGSSVDQAWTWRAKYTDGKWAIVFAQPVDAHIGLDLLEGVESKHKSDEENAWLVRENWVVD